MKLAAVVLARVIFFVESVDLNPRGAAYYPEVIDGFVKRYNFLSYPQKLDDFDEQKGVTLAGGKAGDKVIDKAVIYNWGITLDTTSSTADSEGLLQDALRWGAANLRLNYDPKMVRRKSYVSQITFYSDAPLLSLNPVLHTIGQQIGKLVSANVKLAYDFYPIGFQLGIDPETHRIPVQNFTVERRQGVALSEGKYFSGAPVPTEAHVALIEALEKASAPVAQT